MADNQEQKIYLFDYPAVTRWDTPVDQLNQALDTTNVSSEERSLAEAFHGGYKNLQHLAASYMMKTGKQLLDPEGFEHEGIGRWLFETGEDWYTEVGADIADDKHRPRWKDVEGVGETSSWFADAIAEQIPLMAPGVIGGGLVGIAAAAAGWPVLAVTGAVWGTVGLTSYLLNTGDAYSKQLQKGGKIDEDVADVAGVVAAAFDVIIPGVITGKVVKALGPKLSKNLRDGLQKNVAKNLRLNTAVGTRIKRGITYALVEGSTEYLQEGLLEASVNYVNDLPPFDYSPEQKEIMTEAFWVGWGAGGAFGVTTPTGSRAQRKALEAESAAADAEVAASEAKAAADEAVLSEAVDESTALEAIEEVAAEAPPRSMRRRGTLPTTAPPPATPEFDTGLAGIGPFGDPLATPYTRPGDRAPLDAEEATLETGDPYAPTRMDRVRSRRAARRAERSEVDDTLARLERGVEADGGIPVITGPAAETVTASDAGLLDIGEPIRPIRKKFETAGETGRVLGRRRREAKIEAEAAARAEQERLDAIEAERILREKREAADIEAESVALAESSNRQIQDAVNMANTLMDLVLARGWDEARTIRFTSQKAGDISASNGQAAADAFNAVISQRMAREAEAKAAESAPTAPKARSPKEEAELAATIAELQERFGTIFEERPAITQLAVSATPEPAKPKKRPTTKRTPPAVAPPKESVVWSDDRGVLTANVGVGTPAEAEVIVKEVDGEWVAWVGDAEVTTDGMPESDQKVFKSSEDAKRFVIRQYGSEAEAAAIPKGRPKTKAATAGATPSAPSSAPAPAAAPSPSPAKTPTPKIKKPAIGPNMTKKEFDYYSTQEAGVLSQKRINYIAAKRVRGTELNKWESGAILWDNQAERVARAEGRIRKATEKPAEKPAAARKPLRVLPYSKVTTNEEGIPLQIEKNDEGTFNLLLGVEDQNVIGVYKSRSTAKNVADGLTSSDVGKRLAAPLKLEARTLRRDYSDWKKRAVALRGMGEQKREQAERDAETYRIYKGPLPVPRKVGERFTEVAVGVKELPDGRYEVVAHYHKRRGVAVKGSVTGKRAAIPLALFHADTRAGAEAIRDSIITNQQEFYDLVRMHHEVGNRFIEMGRGDNRVLFHMDEDAFLENWLSRVSPSERVEIENAFTSPDVPVAIDIEEATAEEAAMAEKAKAIASANKAKADQRVLDREATEKALAKEERDARIEAENAKKKVDDALEAEEDIVTVEGELVDKPVGIVTDSDARRDVADFFEQVVLDQSYLTDQDFERIGEIYRENPMIELGDRQITAQEYILEQYEESGFSDQMIAERLEVAIPDIDSAATPPIIQYLEESPLDGIESISAKLDLAQPELTVSHVGATDIEGRTDDTLRTLEMQGDLNQLLGRGSHYNLSLPFTETKIDIIEGNDFLEGAGHGADIVVLHRIPDEATARSLDRVAAEIGYEGGISEGHTLDNWKQAISDSGADLVYIFGSGSAGDFNGLDFQRVPGYEMVGDWNQEGDMEAGQYAVLKKLREHPWKDRDLDPAWLLDSPVEEEQTAEQQTQEMIEKEQATAEREAAEAAEEAAIEQEIADAEQDLIIGQEPTLDSDELAITDWDATKEIEAEIRNERRLAQKKTDANRVEPSYVLGMTPEEIKRSLKRRPSEGGYSAVEINTLLQNIVSWGDEISTIRGGEEVLIDPSITQKATRKAKTEAILDWHKLANDYVILRDSDQDAFDVPEMEIDEAPEFMVEKTDDGMFLKKDEGALVHNVVKNNTEVKSRFRKAMHRIWGITATKRMEKIGFIKYVTFDEAKELIPSFLDREGLRTKITDRYLAYSAPTGGIIFITDNLRKYSPLDTESVRGIVFHELGVHFGKGIFSNRELASILDLTKDMWRMGNPEINEAYDKVVRSYLPKEAFTAQGLLNKRGVGWFRGYQEWGKVGEEAALVGEGAAVFWEEVLAHFVENSSPDINPTLWQKIQTSFKLFMRRLLSTWTDQDVIDNFTTNDLKNTISYALRHVPDMALARYGDTRAIERLRNKKRADFLEESVVKRPLYHYTTADFHYPVYEFTELGMHLGTMDAAIRVGLHGNEHQTMDNYGALRGQPGIDFIDDPYDSSLYNRNLKNVVLNWGRPFPVQRAGKRTPVSLNNKSLIVLDPRTEEYYYVSKGRNFIIPVAGNEEEISTRQKIEMSSREANRLTTDANTAEFISEKLGSAEGRGIEWAQFEDKYVIFPQGGSIKEGYASIKNPLRIPIDLYAWHMPSSWGRFIDLESLTDQSVIDALGSEWSQANRYTGPSPIAAQMSKEKYEEWNDFIVRNLKHQAFLNSEIAKANQKVWDNQAEEQRGEVEGIDHELVDKRDSLEEDKEIHFKEFSRYIRDLLTDFGFDSIEYINYHEHELSRSYIVFNDGQFKTTDSLAWRPENLGMGFKKVLDETVADEVKKTMPLAVESTKQLGKGIVGNARADGFLTKMQKLVEPLATVPGWEELEVGRMLAKGESTIAVNQARVIFDILNQANRKEKKAIFEYFTTRGASPDSLPTRTVDYAGVESVLGGRRTSGIGVDPDNIHNVSIKDKVIEVKKSIEGYGEELVDRGLISQDQYSELKGKYLPQLYLKYLVDDSMRRSLGTGLKASTLDYTKARKVHDEWIAQILFGKIDDPAFLASRYVGQVGRDISIIKYLQFIASDPGNNKWVIPQQLVSYRGINGTADFFLNESAGLSHRADITEKTDPERAKEMRTISSEMNRAANSVQDFSVYNQKMYKRMPSHPRYGAMRGLLVRKEIYDDLVGLSTSGEMSLPQSFLSDRGWGTKITQVFKYTRVPMNIPTQARNFVSNMILLHTSGAGGVLGLGIPRLITKSMSDIVNNGKYMQIARKYGIEGTTFATEELARIDRELLAVKASGDTFEGAKARAAIFFDNWIDIAGRAYQKSEVLFKVAKIMDGMEKGLKESDAVRAANNAIIDYSQVSQGIRYLRRVPFGSPFITFNAKVLPQLLRNLKSNPLHFLPYVALPYIIKEALIAQHEDLDDEDVNILKRLLPEWARERAGIYFLPFKDENNRWTALDLGYMLPWTAHFELSKNLGKGEFGKAFGNTGMFTGPMDLVVGLKTNQDPFLNKEIWNDSDPAAQQYQDILGFITSYIVPPFMSPRNQSGDTITGGGPIIKLMMASGYMDGNIDSDGLPRYTVPRSWASMFGFNTYNVNELSAARNVQWMEREALRIEKRLNNLLLNPNLSMEKRQKLYTAYVEHLADKVRKTYEYYDSVKGYEKMFQ